MVVPETTSLVTGLVFELASNNIQNQCVTRDLLVLLNLDNVTSLNATPVADLEALVSLGEDEFLNWLTVDFFSSLL